MTNYETPIIGDYVDPAELHELWTNGPLVSSRHPELPLTVYNYTSKRAIREEEWTPLVSACRGLVVRDDGLIVARPFSRMREIGLEEQLPPGAFTAFEKLDGTMGVQYPTPEGPMIATRGSFIGRQAIRGSQLLQPYRDFDFGEGVTPVWEIIYPDNRIVVDYGDREELVLLGLVKNDSGEELPLPDQADVPFSVVKSIDGISSADDLRALEVPNAEGYVVRMHESGERIKVKFDSFNVLTAVRKGMMPYIAWKELMEGSAPEAYIEAQPIGARDEVARVVDDLRQRFYEAEMKLYALHRHGGAEGATAQVAEQLARMDRGFPPSVQAIWQMVRPVRDKRTGK